MFPEASAFENHLYSRYFSRDLKAGQVTIRGAAYPTVTPIESPPKEEGAGTLSEKIARRKPAITKDPPDGG